MGAVLGRFCLVLHGHLPYVLHHGTFPHGEAWLFEAAAETYLPLIDLLDELATLEVPAAITVGLTPVLLAQLASDRFKKGFVDYLTERAERADQDRRDFDRDRDKACARLAGRWREYYVDRLERFRSLRQGLPAAFAAHARAGRIQLLTGPITHGYLPLFLNDRSICAQLRAGVAMTERITGLRPPGLWLPECAYRPAESSWNPPVLGGGAFARPGLEKHLAGNGLTHFVVDTHLVERARPAGIVTGGKFQSTSDALVYWDQRRGWQSPMDPVGLADDCRNPSVFAFARHPRVSDQVWSDTIGYPGAAEYLDFHSTHGEHGLRYRRVTDHHSPASQKLPYEPSLTSGKSYEHAQHFCDVIKQTLAEYTAATGRLGTVTAPFDAELFGHWWFEGPMFLRDVLMTLGSDPQVQVVNLQQSLTAEPVDKVVRLPEGSWGEGGHHHVWLNDQTRWMWECEYRAETRLLSLIDELPWRQNQPVEKSLQSAARELLLLQSSDWPFAVHGGAATDYGITRFANHSARFDRLATIAGRIAAGAKLSAVERSEQTEADAHDGPLGEVDLDWFCSAPPE